MTFGLDAADGRSLRSNFLARAAAEPGAPALLAGGRTWSYGEADGIARTWAAALLEGLDERPRRVGVLGSRSEASYLGTLAALMAGATFVPLNPRFPAARTEMMVRLADLDAIVADAEHLEALWPVLRDLERAPLLLLPGAEEPPAGAAGMRVLTARDVARLGPLGVLPPVLPFESAYLLFTSGSTGVPKGVGVTHANALHFIDVMAARYGSVPAIASHRPSTRRSTCRCSISSWRGRTAPACARCSRSICWPRRDSPSAPVDRVVLGAVDRRR